MVTHESICVIALDESRQIEKPDFIKRMSEGVTVESIF